MSVLETPSSKLRAPKVFASAIRRKSPGPEDSVYDPSFPEVPSTPRDSQMALPDYSQTDGAFRVHHSTSPSAAQEIAKELAPPTPNAMKAPKARKPGVLAQKRTAAVNPTATPITRKAPRVSLSSTPSTTARRNSGGSVSSLRSSSSSLSSLSSLSTRSSLSSSVTRPTASSTARSTTATALRTASVRRVGVPGVPATATTRRTVGKPLSQTPGPRGTRPLWDRKGRLEDERKQKALEAQARATSASLTEAAQRQAALAARVEELESLLSEAKAQLAGEREARQQLQKTADDAVREIRDLKGEVATQRDLVARGHQEEERLQGELRSAAEQLTRSEAAHGATRQTLAECQLCRDQLRAQVADLQIQGAGPRAHGSSVWALPGGQLICLIIAPGACVGAGLQVAQRDRLIAEYEAKMRADEQKRRAMHNTIQELKGNIRVYCRVRPPLRNEAQQCALGFPADCDNMQLELVDEDHGRPKKFNFTFDKVFPPTASQGMLFEEVAPLVQSALDGYQVCIFAYGQTGSGKTNGTACLTLHTVVVPASAFGDGCPLGQTYTMQGAALEDPTSEGRGVIPRAVEQIFRTKGDLERQGWAYTLTASFVEIYNETLRDLLVPPAASPRKLEIHHEGDDVTVPDLTAVPVTAVATVFELIGRANAARATAATMCNEQSSRSHSVFILRITGRNAAASQTLHGVLNLVDLAGSERLAQSGATGDRLKETQAINKSLAALGDVIMARANGQAHIPLRNSKLTTLLQPALAGDAKCLMLSALSPLATSIGETLCTLRFADKASNAQPVRKPKRKMELSL
ncbi:putative Carboxy-terminal kinesin 2 [Paratrimastix pyriformis]|uniref:Kinesin-like protein n=1 Tax=Paratrimastix pyriformis TaxID=342808 RepID=A0ABQ8UVW2_9EUKA|nr:putative Carboxy-terminal kinesin 2 [Paratrimastix pyriformis]